MELRLNKPANAREKEFNNLKKEDVAGLLASLGDILKGYNVTCTSDSDKKMAALIKFFSVSDDRQKLNKEELVKIYLSFCSDIGNMIQIANASQRLKDLLLRLLSTAKISSGEAEKILGRRIEVRLARYWGNSYFIDAIAGHLIVADISDPQNFYFNTRYHNGGAGRGEPSYSFSLDAKTRKRLAVGLLGENSVRLQTCKDMDGLPEDTVLEDYEFNLPSDLLYLSGYGMSDSLSAGNPATAAIIKRLKKNFNTAAFPDNGDPYQMDRIEILYNSYSLYYQLIERWKTCRKGSPYGKGDRSYGLTDAGDFARFVVKELPNEIKGTWFNMLFPAFKSFTKGWASHPNAAFLTSLLEERLIEADGAWLSLENLKMIYLTTLPGRPRYCNYIPLFNKEDRNKATLRRRRNDEEIRMLGFMEFNWFEEIDYPFLLHWIRLLCALGLVKMAYGRRDEKAREEGAWVKLTALGRYAYGLEKEYGGEPAAMNAGMDVDDATRIITLTGLNNPYGIFLSQVCEQIGRNRYRLTVESLVKNCQSAEEVKSRIENLQKILDISEHPSIRMRIEEALRRANSLLHCPNSYKIYRLRPDVKGVAEMIMGIPEIRNNIILAEQGLILVDRGWDVEFRKICSSHGYIV